MDKVQNLDESGGTEPASPGDEFEPTAEMMVNDFDDEHTLDEEEAMEETEEQKNELSNLEKEKDMPLEALLAMYGYNENENGGASGGEASEEEEEEEENAAEEPETTTEVETKNEDDVNVPLSRAPRLVDENNPGAADSSGEQDEAGNERSDAGGGEESSGGGEAGAVDNTEDLNSEQFEEEEEFVEEERGGHPQSLLSELYKENPGSGVPGPRQLRSGSRPQSEDEEEEDDGDYSPEEDDWKKTIMVGSDYQAQIPDGMRRYGDSLPYENEDKLLWDPDNSNDEDLVNYMVSIKTANESAAAGGDRIIIPQGSHVRDDEQALYLLLQCGYNYDEALRRNRGSYCAAPNVATMSVWSEEECRNFETGLRLYGKDFFLIQQNKVRTRTVGELVQFYYLWKKTERHDVFANKSKLEKKKYTLHPGTTYLEYRDFMEKFLDEQDSSGGGASSSHVHSLLSSDSKRRASPLPMMMQGGQGEDPITADEVRILKSHVEDIARHLSPSELESLVQLTASTRVPNGVMLSSASGTTASGSGGDNTVTSALAISRTISAPENKLHSVAQ